MYKGFIAADSPAQKRLIRQYEGTGTKFDIIIVGSGVGGGVLADALAAPTRRNAASSSWKRARSSTPRTCTTSAGS